MTTAREMIPALGAHVLVRFESLTVECWVKDVKNSWGKPRLLIVPVVGSGEQWVELGRVTIPATTCNWQTETGTINSPQTCKKTAKQGFIWCAEHIQDAKENYPHLPIPTR